MANQSDFFNSDQIRSDEPSNQQPLPTIDYTGWDYTSIKRKLVEIAQNVYGDDYNNIVEQDFGVLLAEYMAFITDLISFKLDYYINESFLSTAILEKSVRKHARRLGYVPTPRKPATYQMAIFLQEPLSVDMFITAGTSIEVSGKDGRALIIQSYLSDSNGNPIFDQPIRISAGTLSVDNIVGVEGQSRSVDSVGNGEPFQAIRVGETDVLEDSIRLFVDGEEWEKVDALVEVGPKPVFRIDQDDRDFRYYVVVGDGVRGSTIPRGAQINVSYRKGGGQRGNVPSGFALLTKNISIPGTNLSVPVTFTNISSGSGGYDGDTQEDIRRDLPSWYKSQQRAVTLDDYTFFATKFHSFRGGKVAKARAFLRHAGCSANIVDIYVLEKVNDEEVRKPSEKLIVDMLSYFDEIKMATDEVCIRSGQIVSIDIKIEAHVNSKSSVVKNDVERDIAEGFHRFFNLSNWNFGKSFRKDGLQRFLGGIKDLETVDISIAVDPGFQITNGSYIAKNWELVRPRSLEIKVDYIRTEE